MRFEAIGGTIRVQIWKGKSDQNGTLEMKVKVKREIERDMCICECEAEVVDLELHQMDVKMTFLNGDYWDVGKCTDVHK